MKNISIFEPNLCSVLTCKQSTTHTMPYPPLKPTHKLTQQKASMVLPHFNFSYDHFLQKKQIIFKKIIFYNYLVKFIYFLNGKIY
jgi:hypothetical protein